MKPSFKLLSCSAVALALVCNAYAQASTDDDPLLGDAPGLLGRSYTSFSAGVMQLRGDKTKPTGPVFGTDLNLPIDEGFDYRLAFNYDSASKSGVKENDAQVDTGVAYYYRTKRITPFVFAGIGYDFASESVPEKRSIGNHVAYEAATGVELPLSKVAAVRLGVNFDQSGAHPAAHKFDYAVTGNYWFNDTVGARLGATYRKGYSGSHDALMYIAGLHLSFD